MTMMKRGTDPDPDIITIAYYATVHNDDEDDNKRQI